MSTNIFLNRDRKPVRSLGIEWVTAKFSFSPNSSSTTGAPTVNYGPVSVTLQSTGLYRVTLPGGAPNMQPNFDVALPAGAKGSFIWELDGDNFNATQGYFQIRVMNVGTTTLANFTATTGIQVFGEVMLQ